MRKFLFLTPVILFLLQTAKFNNPPKNAVRAKATPTWQEYVDAKETYVNLLINLNIDHLSDSILTFRELSQELNVPQSKLDSVFSTMVLYETGGAINPDTISGFFGDINSKTLIANLKDTLKLCIDYANEQKDSLTSLFHELRQIEPSDNCKQELIACAKTCDKWPWWAWPMEVVCLSICTDDYMICIGKKPIFGGFFSRFY